MNYEAVIGLEIHVQLKTKSKMFCSCNNASDDASPNSLICPVCTGHPGTLPVPNRQAIEWAVMSALALGCTVPEHSKFDRKHYFYPDLPKGYQISQFDEPIGVHGSLAAGNATGARPIGIQRLHIEEDVGKLTHVGSDTFVDYNRAGTPLMEVVTEPDLRTPEEAKELLHELRLVMRYLNVSNADMEKGELRCDANVSLRPAGTVELHPKTELKNINSFRNVERALSFEIDRQRALWEAGKPPKAHATRGWDDTAKQTVEQRDKEASADYRYFPEPDIPPMHFTPEFIATTRASIAELPAARRTRFIELYGLTGELADLLIRDTPGTAAHDLPLWKYFEEVITEFREYAADQRGASDAERLWETERSKNTRFIAKFLLNRIPKVHRDAYGLPVPAADVARLLWMVHESFVTMAAAQTVYEAMRTSKKGPHLIIEEQGLATVRSEAALEPVIQKIIDANPTIVADYRKGKASVLQFLIGQVMKETKGAAQAPIVREMLERLLNM